MIRVWRIPLDPSAPPAEHGIATLTDDERARAARFRFDRDRNRWLGAHVALRRILGAELGVAAERIRYLRGPAGKPAVAWPADTGLEFNLSDSGDLALLALSRIGPVGVDVEHLERIPDFSTIAESHFADDERRALLALPSPDQLEGFYRIWTRKEAYIKAIGIGLGFALDRFAVTLAREAPRLLHIDGDADRARAWSLHDVSPSAHYVGALAVERADAEVVVMPA